MCNLGKTGNWADIVIIINQSISLQVSISWVTDVLPAKIYDFEVGFSSVAGSTPPDLMTFTSTRQNPRIRIQHAHIPDGTPFYIIIKGISGSNIEGTVVSTLYVTCGHFYFVPRMTIECKFDYVYFLSCTLIQNQ